MIQTKKYKIKIKNAQSQLSLIAIGLINIKYNVDNNFIKKEILFFAILAFKFYEFKLTQ